MVDRYSLSISYGSYGDAPCPTMGKYSDGEYVPYDDYAKLEAENKALRELTGSVNVFFEINNE